MGELFGKIAQNGLDVYTDLRIGRSKRDDKLRRMGDSDIDFGRQIVAPRADRLRLAVLVGPYLDIGVTPARLMEIFKIAPDGLLDRDAPEEPFGATRDRTLHLRGLSPFWSVQDDIAQDLEPQLFVALEHRVRNVCYHGRRDIRPGISENLGRHALRNKACGGLKNNIAEILRHTLGNLLPAVDFHDDVAVSARHRYVAKMGTRSYARKTQIAVETRALLEPRPLHLKTPETERERKRARELLMASPQHESARHDLEKQRIYRPRRHQGKRYAARRRRDFNLVVDSAFGPALREHDSAQAAAETELRRIDIAP